MEKQNLLAKPTVTVAAPAEKVWEALVTPSLIEKYMMGSQVESGWKEGSDIVWKGVFKGKPFEDKGKILKLEPGKVFQYSHFSAMAGQPDIPENYHTVTVRLSPEDQSTEVTLSQDKNATEESKNESEKNWSMMLEGLKKVVEGN